MSEDKLIRLSDAIAALRSADLPFGYGHAAEVIRTIPAVQPSTDVAALVDAVEAAFACGMIPKSSAADGGASKYSEQVRVADLLRAALAAMKEG